MDNPTRHVVIAMMLTALIFFIAGDTWDKNIARFQPVKVAAK